jgi:hypothetical protein
MTALVDAMPPDQYRAKIAQLKSDIQKANSQVTVLRAYLTKTGNL